MLAGIGSKTKQRRRPVQPLPNPPSLPQRGGLRGQVPSEGVWLHWHGGGQPQALTPADVLNGGQRQRPGEL